jgi:Fur family transcriptional regulator, ferric uptake regulator
MGLSAPAGARDTLPHLLARRGLRLTGPRRAVLDVLARSRVPLTVPEIHAHLGERRAHIVSVYRTVHLLMRLRLVRPTDSLRLEAALRGSQRYELAEEFTGHHHHLICQGCGAIEDLDGCLLADAALTQLARYIRRTRRFAVTEHEVRLFGLCRRCAA